MTTTLIARVGILLVAGLLVTACDNRGTFGPSSCASGDRVPVASNAVSAVYFDNMGQPVGTESEDLDGTQNNKMCPTPTPDTNVPGTCPSGYCPRSIMGRTYCLRC